MERGGSGVWAVVQLSVLVCCWCALGSVSSGCVAFEMFEGSYLEWLVCRLGDLRGAVQVVR